MRRGRTETSYRANNQLWREGGREGNGKKGKRWTDGGTECGWGL